ncbi:hypothetical protein N496_03950 [Clostridium botulinum A2B3 87]|uniref:condensation domain-containing protein n=1 Tax=Clostridium botulinum TaxID=1491 RepID=UPI0004A58AAF|nr:condensation domain-containing protein [Clostridium botulinum]KEI98767.1 hypothetical protein N496_03950 [Clostridium botulinum A2B3 87]
MGNDEISILQKKETKIYSDSNGQTIFSLGMMQKAMLNYELQRPGSMNFGFAIRIQGKISIDLISHSFQRMINDNDALRIVLFKGHDKEYKLSIIENYKLNLEVIDCIGNTDDEKLKFAKYEIKKRYDSPMDLCKDILFRPCIYKIKDNDYILVINYNHIVTDAVSMILTLNRQANYLFNPSYKHSDEIGSYMEYIKNEEEALKSEEGKEKKDYWKNIMKDFQDYNMPVVRNKINKTSNDFGNIVIKKDIFKDYTIENKTSKFNVILLSYHITLMKIFDRMDTAVSYVVSNRNNKRYKNTLGVFALFCNSRKKVSKSDSIISLLDSLRKSMRDDNKNLEMSLTQKVQPFTISYQPSYSKIPEINGFKLEQIMTTAETTHNCSMFFLNVNEVKDKDNLIFTLACDVNLFGEDLITNFLNIIEKVIYIVLKDKNLTIGQALEMI